MLSTPSILVEEDFTSERMDETSTSHERRLWDWVGADPAPELVIDRPKADELSFRGALEEMGQGARELAFEWMESDTVHPPLNVLERKILHMAIEERRAGELEDYVILRAVSKKTGFPVVRVLGILQSALGKFYMPQREVVANQVVA